MAVARIAIDFIIALVTASFGIWAIVKKRFAESIPYFTVQSNLYCAVVSTVCAVWAIFAEEPQWLLILKYSCTCAITVTFVTVFCYLGPRKKNWGYLLSGMNLWMHLFCPLLAIASLLMRAPIKFPFAVTFAGLAPTVLYGLLYAKKVVLDPPEKRWEDLYGFTKGVKWIWSMGAMLCASFLISLGLWVLLGRIN